MAKSVFSPLGDDAPSLLMAGEFDVTQTGAGLAEGFRLLGWDVAEVSHVAPMIASPRTILRAANRLLQRSMVKSYNDDILTMAARLAPRAMLTVKGNYVSADTLATLRRMGIPTINFYPDYRFDYGKGFDEPLLAAYDLVITTKTFQVPYLVSTLGADRVAMVHHGYVPQVHRRRVPAGRTPQYLWDVCYIGNGSPGKLAWLEPIARRLRGRSMIVIGHHWRKLAAGTALEPHVFGAPLSGDLFARAIEHSRINLAVHHPAGGPHRWADLVSTRTFEIPACGGFMLHIDNPEVRELFVPGVECAVFATRDELVDQIDRYLADEPRRIAIADAGHARAVPAYSLHERSSTIATMIAQRFPRG